VCNGVCNIRCNYKNIMITRYVHSSYYICNSIHYNKVYNTKQYEIYGTIVVNIVPYNTYCTYTVMTLQYNIQYKSTLYRINVQYGTI